MISLFEQMGGTYTLGNNGYYYPDLTLPKDTNFSFSRYGRLHKDYLKKHQNGAYRELLYSGKLNTYLAEIDTQAKEMLQKLTREMNNIRQCAEENVPREIIYA